GTSIPISQLTAAGVQTTFVDAVLSLKVTPHVTQDGSIYLQLQTQNDSPDFTNVGAQGDPTILRKTSKTTVLLRNGETSVIGGIYTRNSGFSQSAVPFFSKIPIIGYFFERTSSNDLRSELLIFITPRIVNQSAATVRTGP
ncbi:MAG: type IV pilus secretin PilQ, partial [Bradymonadia bacterium]